MSDYEPLSTRQELMRQTISQLLASNDGMELSDTIASAEKIVAAILGHDYQACVEPNNDVAVVNSATQVAGVNLAESFDFGLAIHCLKAGEKVQRKGWNGSGMYVYYVPAATYPAQRNSKSTMAGEFEDDMVPYRE